MKFFLPDEGETINNTRQIEIFGENSWRHEMNGREDHLAEIVARYCYEEFESCPTKIALVIDGRTHVFKISMAMIPTFSATEE